MKRVLQDEGERAAQYGEPRTVCPYSPSSDEGRAWLHGWTIGARDEAPLLAETMRMRREAVASARALDPQHFKRDPAAAILGLDVERERWPGSYHVPPMVVTRDVALQLLAVGKAAAESCAVLMRQFSEVMRRSDMTRLRDLLAQSASTRERASDEHDDDVPADPC